MKEIMDVIKKYKGRRGLIARKLGINLEQLSEIIDEVEDFKKQVDDEGELRDQLLKDLFDIQLEYSLVLKEKWALNYMAAKNAGIDLDNVNPIPVSINIPVEDGKISK